jgi:hypothetical protein
VRDDDHVPAIGGLRDRFANQRANVVAAQLSLTGRSAVRERPRLAALRDPLEQAGGKRLSPLFVRNLRGIDPARGSRTRDDLVVDVEEPQQLGYAAADLLASRARCVRDAHDAACHVTTL